MIDLIQFTGEQFPLGFKKVLQAKQLHIVEGGTDEKNRKAVENKQVDILLSPERGRARDYMYQRDSGLNKVLCKLAQKNQVAIGFSFSELLQAKKKAKVLGKMMQNVRLCRKYKVRMVLASFAKDKWEMRSALDLLAVARTLGMSPGEARKSLAFQKKRSAIKTTSKSHLLQG